MTSDIRISTRPIASSLWFVLLLSCVSDESLLYCPDPSIDKQQNALVNGTEKGAFWAISPEQSRAIGRVWPDDAPEGYFCTGVLIARRWVLTARHCDWGGSLAFELEESFSIEPRLFNSVSVSVNSEHDVLLIEMEQDVPVTPIDVMGETISESWIERLVQLAGYGSTEDGLPSDALLFLVEPIVQVTRNDLVVSGFGRSGACIGDSGGPMLVREHGLS